MAHKDTLFVIVGLGAGRSDALLCQTERPRGNATALYESVGSDGLGRRRV